jgi:hypothetical protein
MKILAWPALGAFALVVACFRPSGTNGRTSTESRTLEAEILGTIVLAMRRCRSVAPKPSLAG